MPALHISSPSLSLPNHTKKILLYPKLLEDRKPEARTLIIKTPVTSYKYINTRSTAHPKQIFHYPNPPQA